MDKEKEGVLSQDNETELSTGIQELANMAGKYPEKVEEVSESIDPKDQSTEKLSEVLEKKDGYELYGPELEERLKRDEEIARLNTLAMEADPNRSGALILVCAQHPLTSEGKPGKAFSARLDEAILRYRMMSDKGEPVTIRVPGAVHAGDNISLSEAGARYLIENGIPEEAISADGTEENGTDEVTFAYSIFEQAGHKQFHICCGENQVFRNKMACMELLGFLPYFHTATVLEEMPHRIGFEVGNPNGGLRFLRVDGGVVADNEAKRRHKTGEDN